MSARCRAEAARVIAEVMAGASLEEPLRAALERSASDQRALLQQLCYGTLRHFHRYQGLLRQLMDKKLKRRDTDISALILCGMHQLLDMRTPDHAAISETVDACRVLKKPWATRLVNGVLRRCLRESEPLHQALSPAEMASHPDWLFSAIEQHWPDQAAAIMAANNAPPPMCLRINTLRVSREEYLATLGEAGIQATACEIAADAVRLERGVDVAALPGFDAGWVSIQDEAAQLSADLLPLMAGERVLDACSAPGGKTCHLLERQPELGHMVAMDLSENRLARVQENLDRLELHAELLAGDAASAIDYFEAESFDAILVDAPCSGSGVIRRHPDIKLLRRSEDIAGFAETQLQLLQGLWPVLKPGGRLLYVTCSILPAENNPLISRFLQSQAGAQVSGLEVSWGVPAGDGRQLLQQSNGPDGLFFCRLDKVR